MRTQLISGGKIQLRPKVVAMPETTMRRSPLPLALITYTSQSTQIMQSLRGANLGDVKLGVEQYCTVKKYPFPETINSISPLFEPGGEPCPLELNADNDLLLRLVLATMKMNIDSPDNSLKTYEKELSILMSTRSQEARSVSNPSSDDIVYFYLECCYRSLAEKNKGESVGRFYSSASTSFVNPQLDSLHQSPASTDSSDGEDSRPASTYRFEKPPVLEVKPMRPSSDLATNSDGEGTRMSSTPLDPDDSIGSTFDDLILARQKLDGTIKKAFKVLEGHTLPRRVDLPGVREKSGQHCAHSKKTLNSPRPAMMGQLTNREFLRKAVRQCVGEVIKVAIDFEDKGVGKIKTNDPFPRITKGKQRLLVFFRTAITAYCKTPKKHRETFKTWLSQQDHYKDLAFFLGDFICPQQSYKDTACRTFIREMEGKFMQPEHRMDVLLRAVMALELPIVVTRKDDNAVLEICRGDDKKTIHFMKYRPTNPPRPCFGFSVPISTHLFSYIERDLRSCAKYSEITLELQPGWNEGYVGYYPAKPTRDFSKSGMTVTVTEVESSPPKKTTRVLAWGAGGEHVPGRTFDLESVPGRVLYDVRLV